MAIGIRCIPSTWQWKCTRRFLARTFGSFPTAGMAPYSANTPETARLPVASPKPRWRSFATSGEVSRRCTAKGTYMSKETQRKDITKRRVVYKIPDADAVTIRRDVEYRANDAGIQTMDMYYPPESKSGARIPAVVFVSGFSDLGFQKMLGCKLKEMESYISWGQLTAASGLVAITYTNREPADDLHALLQYVRQNAESLGIDETR